MAEGLFLLSKIKANAVLGFRRLHTLVFNFQHKKLLAGTTATLVLFAVPYAAQAVTGGSGQADTSASHHIQDEPVEFESESQGFHEVKSQSTTEVNVHSDASSSSTGDGEVDVTINGQDVPVPKNGHVQKQITGNNSQTTVDIQIQNESNSSSSHSSTTEIEVDSYSQGSDSSSRRTLPRSR